MALNFFKQRDIDALDAGNIPEEFINYFDSLSEDRKDEIIRSRPDLAEGLGYTVPKNEVSSRPHEDITAVGSRNITEAGNSPERTHMASTTYDSSVSNSGKADNDVIPEKESAEDELAQIRQNRYEKSNFDQIIADNMDPVEALIIQDGVNYCPIHRRKLEDRHIKYTPQGRIRSTYGVAFCICRKCKRIFIKESKAEAIHRSLKKRRINHVFYDRDITERYLKSQMPEYVLGEDEKVYYPDSWIEDHPICPIHESGLFEIDVCRRYRDRKVVFHGYFCQKCNKVITRRAAVSGILDLCSEKGVPAIEFTKLAKKKPVRKPIPRREIKPDYFVENGKRVNYSYKHNADCYRLTEEDTVIVSDSIYCSLEGHQTDEVLALITVEEKRAGKKAYLVMVG